MKDKIAEIIHSIDFGDPRDRGRGDLITEKQAVDAILKLIRDELPPARKITKDMRTGDLMENVGHNNYRNAMLEILGKGEK